MPCIFVIVFSIPMIFTKAFSFKTCTLFKTYTKFQDRNNPSTWYSRTKMYISLKEQAKKWLSLYLIIFCPSSKAPASVNKSALTIFYTKFTSFNSILDLRS